MVNGATASCEEDIPTVHIVRNNTIATRVNVEIISSKDDVDDIADEFDDGGDE